MPRLSACRLAFRKLLHSSDCVAAVLGNMSTDLVWGLVNKFNSFKRKGRVGNRVILSAEPGNLYNKHSFKYSGLANAKTIDIQPGEGETLVVTTRRPKNKSKPSSSRNTYSSKKNTRQAATSIGKEAKKIRPDLKKAAQARVSAIGFLQRKQKAAARSS